MNNKRGEVNIPKVQKRAQEYIFVDKNGNRLKVGDRVQTFDGRDAGIIKGFHYGKDKYGYEHKYVITDRGTFGLRQIEKVEST